MRAVTLDQLDRPDSDWNRAVDRSRQPDPFCCRTEWMLSYHETFAPLRALRLRREGDSHLALAARSHFRLGLLLEPIEAHWFFGTALVGPDAVELLLAEEEHWRREGFRTSVLLGGLLPRGRLLQRLQRALGEHRELHRGEPTIECTASLAGGIDGYLGRRSGTFRRNLRAAARRAADAGVDFERQAPRSAAEADAAYARMLAVEQASWKGLDRCGMAEPPSREFYGVMLRRLAVSGAGRVVFARARDTDIGFLFGGLAGAVYRGQQFSYVDAWARFGIGNLLQLEQLRWLCEEGARRYDMGPAMDYKRHWAERQVRLETLLALPR